MSQMYKILIQEYDGCFGKGRTVEDIVDWVEDLPPMPDVIARALRLVDDPNAMPGDLAEVIIRDQILVSSIFRVANSAGMGRKQEATTLDAAILQIGMGQTKAILFASALRRLNHNFGPLDRLVWEKSLGAASAAHVLCEQLKKAYRDELYLAGLLHNLGQIVFLSHQEIAGAYPAVLERIREHGEDYATAEREVIGFSHPLVGALVARKWKLPLATCQTILHYVDPFEGVFGEENEKLWMLKLATEVGMAAGFGCPEGQPRDMAEINSLALAVGFGDGTQEPDFFEKAVSATKTRFAAEASACQ